MSEYTEIDRIIMDRDRLQAENARLRGALEEVNTICTESAGDCRKRMGTRVGNCIAVVRAALKEPK